MPLRIIRMRFITSLIGVLLLLVLSLHTLHFDHEHPGHIFGEGIQAVLHGENKKWLMALPETFGLSLLSLLPIFTLVFPDAFLSFAERDPVRLALARGRIQKRLYE